MAYLCLDAQVPSYSKTKFLTNASKEHMWHKIAAASLWACLKKKNHTLSQEDVVITIELDAATESLAFTAVERDIES
jgi:hypothetical protein